MPAQMSLQKENMLGQMYTTTNLREREGFSKYLQNERR